MAFSGRSGELRTRVGHADTSADAHHPHMSELCAYGSVSAGREFWPFRVIFFQKVERSCGQTVKDRFDFSIDLGQLCLEHPRNTFVWPQKKIWSRVQHPYFNPFEPFLGKD